MYRESGQLQESENDIRPSVDQLVDNQSFLVNSIRRSVHPSVRPFVEFIKVFSQKAQFNSLIAF